LGHEDLISLHTLDYLLTHEEYDAHSYWTLFANPIRNLIILCAIIKSIVESNENCLFARPNGSDYDKIFFVPEIPLLFGYLVGHEPELAGATCRNGRRYNSLSPWLQYSRDNYDSSIFSLDSLCVQTCIALFHLTKARIQRMLVSMRLPKVFITKERDRVLRKRLTDRITPPELPQSMDWYGHVV